MAQNVQDSVTVVEKDIATHRDHTGAVEVDSTVRKPNPNFCLLGGGHL